MKLYDEIEIKFSSVVEEKLKPSKIKLDIRYEDNDILIINKPKV